MTAVTSTVSALKFEAPAPGTWELDRTHVPRPLTRFAQEAFRGAFEAGFHEMTSRYGMMLDYLDGRFINGFMYDRAVPVSPEEVPARFAAAEEAFTRKLWREDMDRWDREVKSATIRSHLALQAIDPASLDTEALLAHLGRCRSHLREMVTQHHRFNGAAIVPLGDFLVHALEWTGLPPSDLLRLMRGSAPVSAGASQELEALAQAIHADAAAQATLRGDEPPAEKLARLTEAPGPAGEALAAYLELVGYRIVDGFDIGNPYVLEMPETMVAAIEGALDGAAGYDEQAEAEHAARVREAVPPAHRDGFDELLEEARYTYRLRDERGVFSDIWALGLTRRAVLEAGRGLARQGRIEKPEHLVEAGYEEMRSLLGGADGPSSEELAERAKYRASALALDAPPFLGDPPQPPPSPEGLPPAAARMARAVGFFIGSLFGDSERPNEKRRVFGLAASPGVYEGTARLVHGPEDFHRIEQGDVLLAHSTSEAFNLLLPKLGAIVSDSGGLLSHPAIVAREFGIPGVVGTREGTRIIPDGARVRVDGEAGEVTVLS